MPSVNGHDSLTGVACHRSRLHSRILSVRARCSSFPDAEREPVHGRGPKAATTRNDLAAAAAAVLRGSPPGETPSVEPVRPAMRFPLGHALASVRRPSGTGAPESTGRRRNRRTRLQAAGLRPATSRCSLHTWREQPSRCCLSSAQPEQLPVSLSENWRTVHGSPTLALHAWPPAISFTP